MLEQIKSGNINWGNAPYAVLIKSAATIDTLDTCGRRLENHFFDIILYDTNFKNLINNINDIQDTIDNSELFIQRRRFTSLLFSSRLISETSKGMYEGILSYEVIAEKDIPANAKFQVTSGDSIYEALFTRFEAYPRLNEMVNGFVTTAFADFERPFIFIPEIETVESWATTCNTRIEHTNFEMAVEHTEPDLIEDILEEIDDTYSYCGLNLSSREQFLNLEWQGNTLRELESGLWRGGVDYQLQVEKSL